MHLAVRMTQLATENQCAYDFCVGALGEYGVSADVPLRENCNAIRIRVIDGQTVCNEVFLCHTNVFQKVPAVINGRHFNFVLEKHGLRIHLFIDLVIPASMRFSEARVECMLLKNLQTLELSERTVTSGIANRIPRITRVHVTQCYRNDSRKRKLGEMEDAMQLLNRTMMRY